MSLSWCRSICGISPSLSSQIEVKLREVAEVFPYTIFIVILTRDGEIIAQSNSLAALSNSSSNVSNMNMKGAQSTFKSSSASLNKPIPFSSYHSLQTSQVSTTQDLIASIMTLMKTANELVNALSQPDCPVLHVRGHHHLFSCYAVDTNLLAFYSELQSVMVDSFNSSQTEARMQDIIADLRLLLENVVVAS